MFILPSSHLCVLFFLYALQGVPYGLQSRFLPLILRSHGASLTALGFYKLLYLPWVFKSTYAPLVDTWGSKRLWLQVSIAGLFACSAALSTITETHLVTSRLLLPVCLFVFNFWAATLDIAVDSVAIAILTHSELLHGNTAQVVGYKFGAVVGGGFLSWLSSFLSLSLLFSVLCAVYLVGLSVATMYKRLDAARVDKTPASGTSRGEKQDIKGSGQGYLDVIKSAIFDSPSTPTLIVLLLVYKLGEMGAMNMLPLMLLDHGMPVAVIGFWTGVVGQITSITGSSFAAVVVKRFKSSVDCLRVLFCYRLAALLLLAVFALAINRVSLWCGVFLMNATLLVSGTITTTVFTLMMECTRKEVPPTAQATHYTVLSTAEILGKLVFATVASSMTDLIGYRLAYVVFLLISIPPICIVSPGRAYLSY